MWWKQLLHHQYALSRRAGTECIAHILQTLTEDDPRTTVLSIDGIGAFNLISRKSMLEALMTEGGPQFHATHHLAGVEGFEVPSSVPDHMTRKIVSAFSRIGT